MMLLRILRPSLSFVQSSRFLPGNVKLFSTTIKIEEFDYLNDYVLAVLKECRTNEKPMPWKSITPNLINTLPVSKQNSKRGLNPMQVDLFVVSVLSMENEPKALLDFVVHKKEKNTELSIAPLEQVLKAWNRSLEGITSEADKNIVRNLCYEITERPHENHGTKIKAIGVLARLGDVKEAFEILVNSQLIKFPESKSGVMFTARNLLISALSDYDSYQEIFWEVIESDFFHCETVGGKAVSPSEKSDEKFSAFQTSELQDEVYCAFIEKFKNDQSELEKLFEHFRQFCVFARPPVQNLLLKHFIRGSAVTDRRGLCYNCKERIPSFTFSKEECQDLIQSIMTNVLEKDIYGRSFPQEYANFKEFLNRDLNPEFDVVVDGLNLGFASARSGTWRNNRNDQNDKRALTGQYKIIVDGLIALQERGFKNILLIHRTWLARSREFLRIQNLCSSHFLLDKLSADDPFAIIAALHFGPGTYIVSNDLFRPYLFALDNVSLKNAFIKWQFQHQIMHTSIKGSGGENVIKYKIPPKHEVMISKTKQHWHLPLPPQEKTYVSAGYKFTRKTHLIPDKYLCLSLKSIKDVNNTEKEIES